MLVSQLLNLEADDETIFRSQTALDTLECDFKPPKSDSYFNLYDDEHDMPLGGSAHSLRNMLLSGPGPSLGPSGPNGHESECRLAPDAMYSPVRHANPTVPRLSDVHASNDDAGAYLVQKPAPPTDVADDAVLPSDAKYPTVHALAPDNFGAGILHTGSRRPGRFSPTKTKDATSAAPTQTALPASESELLAIADVNISASVRRPMSFVKALELSDRLEETQRKQRYTGGLHDTPVPEVDEEAEDVESVDRDAKRKFGSSYEIAV